jgi:molybdenum cofactor cytidylyltransferase
MLLDVLPLAPGACVAVVGAGGKTSLCWRLARELAQRGRRAVFTTTTRIRQPAPGAFDQLAIGEADSVIAALRASAWLTACAAARVDGPVDGRPAPGWDMPVVHTKLAGFPALDICDLRRSLSNPQSPISFLVEADGARGLRLKAPGEAEPVIPPCADLVCVVANLDAIGRPLDERAAHRPERIARLTGAEPGAPITPELVIALLAHPDGGLKGIPQGARGAAVLTQEDARRPHPAAATIAQALLARGYDAVLS